MFEDLVLILLSYIAVKVWQIDRRLRNDETPSLFGSFLSFLVTEHWIDILGVTVVFLIIWYLKTHSHFTWKPDIPFYF
jgi:hypothetical protein